MEMHRSLEGKLKIPDVCYPEPILRREFINKILAFRLVKTINHFAKLKSFLQKLLVSMPVFHPKRRILDDKVCFFFKIPNILVRKYSFSRHFILTLHFFHVLL